GLNLFLVGVDRLVCVLEFGELLVQRRLLLGGQLAGLLCLGAGGGEGGLERGLGFGGALLAGLDLGQGGEQRRLVLVGKLVGLVQFGARRGKRGLVGLTVLQQLGDLGFQGLRLVTGLRQLRVGIGQARRQRGPLGKDHRQLLLGIVARLVRALQLDREI